MKRKYAIIEVTKRFRSQGVPTISTDHPVEHEISIYEAELSASDLRDVKRNPDVLDYGLIMPARLITPVKTTKKKPSTPIQAPWGISAVGADQTGLDGTGVVVAVLDTGIDKDHLAFAGIDLVERDFGGSGNGDTNGHGTHCAGTIFGKDVGGSRIGIARNVRRALIAKVFTDSGASDTLSILRAVHWAVTEGANVISMSLGFDFPGLANELQQDGYPSELATSIALEHFKDNLRIFDSTMGNLGALRSLGPQCLVIAAAGNESQRDRDPRFRISASLPSSASGVISVAALRQAKAGLEFADFSNCRAKVCAPGEDILSAAPGGGYATMSGTSMATPHVAGVAALWWQKVAASPIKANAESVTAQLLAGTKTTSLSNFDPDDAEMGLVFSPA